MNRVRINGANYELDDTQLQYIEKIFGSPVFRADVPMYMGELWLSIQEMTSLCGISRDGIYKRNRRKPHEYPLDINQRTHKKGVYLSTFLNFWI